MKRLYYIWFLLFLTACNIRAVDVVQTTEYCFVIDKYSQTICLEEPYDTLHPVIFADKHAMQSKDIKFKKLTMHIMMVVSVNGNVATFSNPNFSVKIRFEKNVPQLQDMYYIIIKEEYLGETLIVEYADPTIDANTEIDENEEP